MQSSRTLAAFLFAVLTSGNSEFLKFGSDELGSPMVHVTIDAPQVFADTPANLTGFSIDTGYTNYNETFFHKMAADLSPDSTLEKKVGAVVSALYGKEYTDSEPNMYEDYDRLFQMAHPATAQDLISRSNPFITWSKGSCEGHDNGSGNGGDVCFSNRATGCT
ncbi:hypothetical protein PG999_002823 [Apiospora kogelbergensis]|uniref:Uncharacterized protein n=1 Tax=Apiospora kogelbergensis TaxID=1337665 RepID=A0AAW0R9L3_9PEZI